MGLLTRIAVTIGMHLIIFLCYNDTSEFAVYYIPISIILWVGILMLLNFGLKLLKFINKYLAYVVYAAIYFLMFLTISFTMPQKDRISVFEKIRAGEFPNAQTINRGIKKLGFKKQNIPVKELKKINRAIGETLDKLEDKSPVKGGE